MSSTTPINRLENEKSAYLRQHRDNPVAWLPYGDEAIELAKKEDKPILVSIGYSSCHWCHVMAHESFEDVTTATFMNENFISIKVDKEEHPDLDQYGQMICQLMNGGGGWPLNVFFTPDMKPFFAGTYFPKVAQGNMPSFMDVLNSLAKAYKDDKETINSNSSQLMEAAKARPRPQQAVEYPGHFPSAAAILNAVKPMADEEDGGYAKAPKFPQFPFYEFAVEQMLEGMIPEEFGKHIVNSLERMLMGGVYDHARGGLHRYAVDKKWLVPHFEKMLYDQAGLVRTLAKLSLIYPSPLVVDAQIQTLNYAKNELLSDQNYFFASQDADSEGVEGLYFTFTKEEFIDALTKSDEELGEKLDEVMSWFLFEDDGNFEQGLNVIALNPAKKEEFYKPENWELVRKIKAIALEERKGRVPPMTDNKGVASWNFMFISALADVVQYSRIQNVNHLASELIKSCVEGLHKTFLTHGAENEPSKILTSTTLGETSALFEDFVFFCQAQLRLYEVSGNDIFKQNGLETLLHIKNAFYKDGVFFTRAVDDEKAFENIPAPLFDQSYQSPLGTYLFLLRKWSLVSSELSDAYKEIEPAIENLKQASLTNPLGFGEMMRAMVYPDEAYKKISMPVKWLKENKAQALFPNFSARFALTYNTSEDESWEICGNKSCEAEGKGFEDFKKIFFPDQNKES